MRTLYLIMLLFLVATLAAFPQSYLQKKAEPTTIFKIGKPGTLSLKDSLNKGKMDVPFNTRELFLRDLKNKEPRIGYQAWANAKGRSEMPVYQPKESFSMPVLKPDSTIKFFLQIKEYKRVPPTDFK